MKGAMQDAQTHILAAIKKSQKITSAGEFSLLTIAARAIDPATPLTKLGIAKALGLEPCLIVSIMVTSDLAGDTLSRRDLGQMLFEKIELGSRVTELTELGQLEVAAFCLQHLSSLDHLIDGLAGKLLPLAQDVIQGKEADPLTLKEIEQLALEFQQTKAVQMEMGVKSKLGVPPAEAIRRRSSQAVRALAHSLQHKISVHLAPTVAGEVAASLAQGEDIEAAAEFCIALAAHLQGLPAAHAERRLGN